MRGRLTILSLAGACLIASMAFTQPQFQHLKRVDLSRYFNTGAPNGEWIGDVAFDGTHAYVAGFAISGSDTVSKPVGVLKISNVLSDSPEFSNLITLNQAGASRDTKLIYHNGALYLGTGLGNSSNDPNLTGVRKYDIEGHQDMSWSGDGVLMPNEIGASINQRTECIEIDPGFLGSGATLGAMNRARGFLFRRDLTTGALASGGNILMPTGNNAWRDVTFSPGGNPYMRIDNDIYDAFRTGVNTVFGNTGSLIIDLPNSTLRAQMNILYVPLAPAYTFDLLVFNSREVDGQGQDVQKKVFVYTGLEDIWQPYAELTGAEPLPDNSTPPAFRSAVLNFTSGVADGERYLFVVHSSASDNSRGDVNGDGNVDNSDLNQILSQFGRTGTGLPSDVNHDNSVDDLDVSVGLVNFGSSQPWRWLDVYRIQ